MKLTDEQINELREIIKVGGKYKLSAIGIEAIKDAPDEAKRAFYTFLKKPVTVAVVFAYRDEYYAVYFDENKTGSVLLVEVFAAMFERIS